MDLREKLIVDHSTLVFYGLHPAQSSLELVYRQAKAWYERFGCVINLMGTSLDRKLGTPTRSEKKLYAAGFEGVEFFEMNSLPAYAENELEGTTIEVAYRPPGKRWSYLIVNCQSSVASIPSEPFLTVAREAIALVRPRYGIGYHRLFGLGPSLYALGFATGFKPGVTDDFIPILKEEDSYRANWPMAQEYKFDLQGALRGVYPWNFLRDIHLNRKVGNLSLENWIRQGPDRGTLTAFTGELWLWEVPAERLKPIRQILHAAEVVFDQGRDIEAKKVQPARPMSGEEVLGEILRAQGASSADDVGVLKVEGRGRSRKLTRKEISEVLKDKKVPE